MRSGVFLLRRRDFSFWRCALSFPDAFPNPLLSPSGKPRAKRRERASSSSVEIKRKAQLGCRQLCFYENKTIGGKLYDSEATNEKNLIYDHGRELKDTRSLFPESPYSTREDRSAAKST